jgi:hypothetical protein
MREEGKELWSREEMFMSDLRARGLLHSGSRSKVGHYIGNRVPFGTLPQTAYVLACKCWLVSGLWWSCQLHDVVCVCGLGGNWRGFSLFSSALSVACGFAVGSQCEVGERGGESDTLSGVFALWFCCFTTLTPVFH